MPLVGRTLAADSRTASDDLYIMAMDVHWMRPTVLSMLAGDFFDTCECEALP